MSYVLSVYLVSLYLYFICFDVDQHKLAKNYHNSNCEDVNPHHLGKEIRSLNRPICNGVPEDLDLNS